MSEKQVLNPWHDEPDWLVCLVWLDEKKNHEARRYTANEIGHLLGFAMFTETRMMAMIGDDCEAFTVFELLFSFHSELQKQAFMALVRANEITNHEDEYSGTDNPQFSVPEREEIESAEALGRVLPADIADLATLVATSIRVTLSEEEDDPGSLQ